MPQLSPRPQVEPPQQLETQAEIFNRQDREGVAESSSAGRKRSVMSEKAKAEKREKERIRKAKQRARKREMRAKQVKEEVGSSNTGKGKGKGKEAEEMSEKRITFKRCRNVIARDPTGSVAHHTKIK
ncbi:hypothetical protein TREMEDRAFT_62087 [Tremella mesenterica DSM 1558]|uniref:uncharacterized protein n=1 Tax=Tremella mesenterica (strain ATCC 24925 / CBS 8224 / DSM 1558 / NBRC 9311 / NRRL Y-6157 / RJB 2259-6 / UBC 559-6) TaxID=578456 RepID=UPI00032D0003|nr:uncharacterized protein TREMEDRAFT_62087 [Tremella mesenterica DSM 1558]XP_007008685.1 uncharacterized protein TREMEDRAFT_66596 [Tremella mesenterica DSM 1558]EIW65424.1 hypothetical protein TREMEDRAFT_66596 [Tremella mesenterica DSM 1558]EIW69236.1 hypothetical protein TREMEDRAFT_62087 [Tremella mesenterica DSM 1558]